MHLNKKKNTTKDDKTQHAEETTPLGSSNALSQLLLWLCPAPPTAPITCNPLCIHHSQRLPYQQPHRPKPDAHTPLLQVEGYAIEGLPSVLYKEKLNDSFRCLGGGWCGTEVCSVNAGVGRCMFGCMCLPGTFVLYFEGTKQCNAVQHTSTPRNSVSLPRPSNTLRSSRSLRALT